MKNYYIAYGSNMNIEQMKYRCPTAKPVGSGFIEDYQIQFNYYATIVPLTGKCVPVAIWEIDEESEKALDKYEGYPNFYRKEIMRINMNGQEIEGMVYVINKNMPMHPSGAYFDIIKSGYRDFNQDISYLFDGIEHTKHVIENSN